MSTKFKVRKIEKPENIGPRRFFNQNESLKTKILLTKSGGLVILIFI
jgi:hypothetical protein